MIDVAVHNRQGKEVESLQVDESLFGGCVRYELLKQAIVMYHANKRVGTAATKSRGMVKGSCRKLFRQKGTGNARVGNARTGKRVGGGVTFAKVARDFGKKMLKMRKEGHECVKNINIWYRFGEDGWELAISTRIKNVNGVYLNKWTNRIIPGVVCCMFCREEML